MDGRAASHLLNAATPLVPLAGRPAEADAASPKAGSSPASTRTTRTEGAAWDAGAWLSSVSRRPGSGGVVSVPRTVCTVPLAV